MDWQTDRHPVFIKQRKWVMINCQLYIWLSLPYISHIFNLILLLLFIYYYSLLCFFFSVLPYPDQPLLLFLYSFCLFSVSSYPAPNNPHKPNQDSLLMKHCEHSSSLIIACFDGHGEFGHDVSWFCKRYIETELPMHPTFMTDLSRAIKAVTHALGETWLICFFIFYCNLFISSHLRFSHITLFYLTLFYLTVIATVIALVHCNTSHYNTHNKEYFSLHFIVTL